MGPHLINTRVETIHSKPSFGSAFRSRRCLIPANGWFEWRRIGQGRQPYFLELADGSPLSFAALWELWDKGGESVESFTIITMAASPALSDIYHRQPAIIDPDRFVDWLDPEWTRTRLLDLMLEPCAGPYERRAVSARANRVGNGNPDIPEPLSEKRLN